MSTRKILGINYNNVTIDEAAKEIYSLVEKGQGGYVVTPNAEIGHEYFKNSDLKRAIDNADYILPDGAGVILASKICGNPLKSRTAGYDVSRELLKYLAENHKKLFILGAKPKVAEKAAENITVQYNGIEIVGTHDGYFKNDTEIIDEINNSNCDVLFVAIGYPRQEIFMLNNKNNIKAFMLGVGGSVDVYAGIVERAPKFYIDHNIEWLYRLKCEPKRIGRMMRLPAYVFRTIWWKISGKARKDKKEQQN